MKLCAISDLHLGYERNRQALGEIKARPEDWLLLVGDIGETPAHLELAFRTLTPRFRQLVWVPGNHELWTPPSATQDPPRGQRKYEQLVALCRAWGVLTPEDPFPVVTFDGVEIRIAPLFLLYDYSFRPDDVPIAEAVRWAMADGIYCTDEVLLHPDPYASIPEWCHARCDAAEARLEACRDGPPLVIVNHFPLRHDLVRLRRVPRFSVWCGTRRTEDWHRRFNAAVVVSGHLHVPSTLYRDQTRFEEVSLGYPRQRSAETDVNHRIREILPAAADR
jgi:predicted phosphodiesterase